MTTIVVEANLVASDKLLNLQCSIKLALMAEDARHLVNRQVVPELGTGLIAVNPELMIMDNQPFWRVPIKLSLPHSGDLGQVGTVLVDALSGQVLLTDKIQQRIINHARWLYQGATLQAK